MKNNYEIRGVDTAIFIKRENGDMYETMIDTESLELAQEIKGMWFLNYNKKTRSFYVRGQLRSEGKKAIKVYLHRHILKPDLSMMVDHLNHDTLDNRTNNLRSVTHSENQQNRKGAKRNNKTGFRCVTRAGKGIFRKYSVNIQAGGVRHFLGNFKRKSDAIQASIEGRKRFQGYSHDLSDI